MKITIEFIECSQGEAECDVSPFQPATLPPSHDRRPWVFRHQVCWYESVHFSRPQCQRSTRTVLYSRWHRSAWFRVSNRPFSVRHSWTAASHWCHRDSLCSIHGSMLPKYCATNVVEILIRKIAANHFDGSLFTYSFCRNSILATQFIHILLVSIEIVLDGGNESGRSDLL